MKPYNEIKHSLPSKLVEKFLHWSLPQDLKEPVLGDLAEEYSELLITQPTRANYWYTRQALRTGLQFLTKTKRGLIMFLLSIFVFMGFVAMSFVQSGGVLMFADLPSLLLVLPPAYLMMLASTSKQSRLNALGILFKESLVLEKSELKAAKHVFTTFGNMSLLMGWIGFVIGAVAMSSNIEPEVFSKVFSSAFAVCILPILYALLIKALCYVAEAKIQFKIIEHTS